MKIFDLSRPRDINLEAGVSLKKEKLTFFMFNDPVLNTLDKDVAMERDNAGIKVIGKKVITTKTLKEIFDAHLPKKNSY